MIRRSGTVTDPAARRHVDDVVDGGRRWRRLDVDQFERVTLVLVVDEQNASLGGRRRRVRVPQPRRTT